MFNAIKSAYSLYFTLNGRASRSEYWWFWLSSKNNTDCLLAKKKKW